MPGLRRASLLLCLLSCTTCAYRLQAPPQLGAPVAIRIEHNDGRLVRGQALLQQEVARELRSRLGWSTDPRGPALLTITLGEEGIDVVATGDLDVPSRWRVTLYGGWRLEAPGRPDMTGGFSGDGHLDDRPSEPRALRSAATSAAREIVASIESRVESGVGDRP